ncbi:MAG: hypothetical protein E6H10_01840 [Bacteroidetes bacterium]|nr:MAG: hypothetical protein E6H10_01840 [Bacteroidota bacterium]
MKNFILLLLLAIFLSPAYGQLKVKATCNAFVVDLLNGKVNDVRPDFTGAQIKAKFPCFTSEEPETSKCGGVINYKDRDLKFFTGRDYVEIGPTFKGTLSIPLMGSKRGSLFKYLGNPKMKDANWDAFETQYGTLILYYNAASKVNLIRFSTKTMDVIQLCE